LERRDPGLERSVDHPAELLIARGGSGFHRREDSAPPVLLEKYFPTREITMVRKVLVLSLLAMSLAAPSAHAQTAPAASQSAASAVDPASIQALKDMGAFLQTLKRFRVSTELTGERVLADGQKLQHTATADMDVERPNKLRALMHSARSERELVYDGKTVTLYTPAQKYYSTVELVDTIGGLSRRLEERYGVELPLSDLFLWGTPAAPLDKIESAMNAGQDFVGNDLCDHYAFRQAKADWQIWITTGSRPLPRKVVITNRTDEARPQSVSLIDWNLKPKFTDSVFKFTPPKGASKIEIVPLKTK
jgi:hypothetical protein